MFNSVVPPRLNDIKSVLLNRHFFYRSAFPTYYQLILVIGWLDRLRKWGNLQKKKKKACFTVPPPLALRLLVWVGLWALVPVRQEHISQSDEKYKSDMAGAFNAILNSKEQRSQLACKLGMAGNSSR